MGAQLDLVQAIKATGKPTVVVLVSGKPVAEPWIQASEGFVFGYSFTYSLANADADAVVQQFYPGELGGKSPTFLECSTSISHIIPGLAIAEIVFGAVNPSGLLHLAFCHAAVILITTVQANSPSHSREVSEPPPSFTTTSKEAAPSIPAVF